MATDEPRPISTPDDPRLDRMGQEPVAGADQILAGLAATPDERLDSLIALVEFVGEAREALTHPSR
jgi:hypothetical protein